MSDFRSVEIALGAVIGSPGFAAKRSVVNLLAEALRNGLARRCNNSNLNFHLRKGQKIHYEVFLNGRLYQVRAEASGDLSPTEEDSGRIPSNSFWYVFGAQSCRSFEIQISPYPSLRVWMIPTFAQTGYGWFDIDGPLCDEYDFPRGKMEFPTNIVVDYLWQILDSIENESDMLLYDRPVSQLRMMFASKILNEGLDGDDVPLVTLPYYEYKDLLSSWDDRRLVHKVWSQARLLVDPLLTLRRKA